MALAANSATGTPRIVRSTGIEIVSLPTRTRILASDGSIRCSWGLTSVRITSEPPSLTAITLSPNHTPAWAESGLYGMLARTAA